MNAEAVVRDLKSRLSGQLLLPADEGYDAARSVFNTMIQRRPTIIARCANAGIDSGVRIQNWRNRVSGSRGFIARRVPGRDQQDTQ